MPRKAIAVTGMAVISPVGTGLERFWNNICRGTSGIAPIRAFDTSPFQVKIGGEVPDFDPGQYLTPGEAARMGRASQFAVAAARMALDAAGLGAPVSPADWRATDPDRVAVCIGTTMGEIQVEEAISAHWTRTGRDSVPGELFGRYPVGVIPANVARAVGARGPNHAVPTACAGGNYAVGLGFDLIHCGLADVVIAGGVDPMSRVAFTGFSRLLSLAPERCQPFDRDRRGLAVSEGAAALVLEPLDRAVARGATVMAEILGYGLGMDAHHVTTPHPEGEGAARAMRAALRVAGVSPAEVDYISAHGTGTPANDKTETRAIKTVFGAAAYRIPVSSIKSMIGHTMGAASAIEAVACVMAIRTGILPPTMNLEHPDPECDLDYVPNQARARAVRVAVSNAFAFGGNTSSLVVAGRG
jgi:3-oxoacyl-[acyl-carrier-protein] synthase II